MKANRVILFIFVVVLLVGGFGVQASTVIGDAIQYDTDALINEGRDITVEFWYWTGAGNLFESLAKQYGEVNPNVTITLVENPWDDYWTKLPLALQGSDGPAIFNFHNSHHDNLIGYMAPYDIPYDQLEADFVGVSGHEIDGKVYYTDYALMTAIMYYNTDMWEAAGLTAQDIPVTWDEFREVAKRLTIRENGKLVQAGHSFNGNLEGTILGMNYQLGQNLFTSDNRVTLNNDAMKDVIRLLADMYEVDGVGELNFGNNAGDNFGQGLVATYLGWGFMTNVFLENYPDTLFDCFEIPIPSYETPYAINRYNGESTFGINTNASPQQQAVAQDIVRFFLANDQVQKEFCLQMGVFPMKKTLQEDPELLAVPSISPLAKNIDRYIWPGPFPDFVAAGARIAFENIFYNNHDVTQALVAAERSINEDLAVSEFISREPLYKHAEEAL